MVKEKEAFIRTIIRVIDASIVIISYVATYFLSDIIRNALHLKRMVYAIEPSWNGLIYFSKMNLPLLIAVLPVWLGLLSAFGMYKDVRTKAYRQTVSIIIKAGFLSLIALGAVIFIQKLQQTSRLFIGGFIVVTIILLVIEKRVIIKILDYIHKRGYNKINLLIVGTGRRAREFIKAVKEHSNWGLEIIGLIDDEHGMFGKEIEGHRVLGRLQDIPFILHRKVIDRVIFVVPRLWLHRLDEVILACEREGIATSISMDLYDLRIAKVRQTNFNGFPLLEFETFAAKEWQLFIKRAFDLVISFVALIVLSPIFLITAIVIKLTSNGPVFFTQTRSGLNGRKFKLYKFRSMHVGAEMKKRELHKMNEMEGPVFKIKRDPRITNVGRFIRKFSIDELPQFFNILKGDMSVVGPRPPLPIEVEMYQLWQRRRLSLKPGLTCVWQVSGRNNVPFNRWMEMDLEYIDNWSLWLDFRIFLKTFFVVLFGYGAS